MKVGILTLPLWHNYGGILQAYALREAVAELGHEAVYLDVRRPIVGRLALGTNRLKRALRRIVRGKLRSPWYPDQRELTEISRHTRAFVEERIRPKTAHISFHDVQSVAHEFDAIIVESDQVWRREYIPDLSTYILMFPDDRLRRISYAASLGVDEWCFDQEESDRFVNGLAKFRAISVREDSAVTLLRRELGLDSSRVCDPTLLFDSDHYRRLTGIQRNAGEGSGRIFTYVLDDSSDRMHALENIVEKIGGVAVNVMPKAFGPRFPDDRASYLFPPVETWLKAFDACEFVITDSFHGCAFSLIFNRPFVAVANVERGKARFESLLSRYGLTNRLFGSIDQVDIGKLTPIDWERVNRIRADERQDGLAFLGAALGPGHNS